MYLSPRRTLSARASGCLTRFGWAYVSGAEPMGSGGWLVICRDLPERRIRTLSPTALLENSASVAEDETVREVAEGWLAGGGSTRSRFAGAVKWPGSPVYSLFGHFPDRARRSARAAARSSATTPPRPGSRCRRRERIGWAARRAAWRARSISTQTRSRSSDRLPAELTRDSNPGPASLTVRRTERGVTKRSSAT